MELTIISDSREFRRNFLKSMRNYSRYYWATAWATDDPGYVTLNGYHFYLMDELVKASKNGKICSLICGLYGAGGQPTTSTKFIRMMKETPNVHFVIKEGDGNLDIAMHCKMYLFVNSPKDWCCYVGSANFTRGGFSENFEVMTKIVGSDATSNETAFLADARQFFDNFFQNDDIRETSEKEIVDYLLGIVQ